MDDTGARSMLHAVGDARRIAVDRVGGEDARTDEPQPRGSEEPGRRHRNRTHSRAPDAGGEQAGQRASREKVDSLDPALVPEGECAHRLPPGAVVAASLTLDERRANEERRHHHAAVNQQPCCVRSLWQFHRRGAYSAGSQ
jgi:hypothetical protein